MGQGFLYLVAACDWASRAVLYWRLSNARMDASFCGLRWRKRWPDMSKPEIFNTDQGSQFTGAAFAGVLVEAGVYISNGLARLDGQRLHRARPALAAEGEE